MREVGHLSTLNNMYIFWVEYLKVFKILKYNFLFSVRKKAPKF